MDSGRPFWDELVYRYQMGVQYVTWMRETWDTLEPYIGARRFAEVRAKLAQHEADAADWRDTSVELLARVQRPADSRSTAAARRSRSSVGGKRVRRLRRVSRVVHDPGRRGRSPPITQVSTARGARYRDPQQATACPAGPSSRSAAGASSARSSRTTCSRCRRQVSHVRPVVVRRATARAANQASRISASTASEVAAQREGEDVGVVPLAGARGGLRRRRTARRGCRRTLLAAIEAPVPVQQATTAWSARPSATSRAAASEAHAQSSRSSGSSAPCSERLVPAGAQLLDERRGRRRCPRRRRRRSSSPQDVSAPRPVCSLGTCAQPAFSSPRSPCSASPLQPPPPRTG